jgi:hypothetical protein
MSYTVYNFKTKKALREAVEAKEPVRCFNPGLGPDLSNHSGKVYLEGPHYPQAHKWYASGEMEDGILVNVK